ncbi:MAG: proteinMgtE intracellular protein [Ilumatobacteraceae bacterium]|nr:proteinMgtE intracellular protein [Ilumatobacteraceae bacterium]
MVSRVGVPLPSVKRLRRRLIDVRTVREQLVSVAGLIGRPVELMGGAEVGRVFDVVTLTAGLRVPEVTGLVIRVGRRRAFVPVAQVSTLTGQTVTLSSAQLDVREFERRDGEVLLMGDVVDHQLVDIDGVQIVRASDLYLAPIGDRIRLVGVEVGMRSLLRRLGPRRFRSRPTPERVIDWTDIQLVGEVGSVRLDRANRELRRLRPADLAGLLEQLGQQQRLGLVDSLDAEVAADALEEMETEQRDRLLREITPERATAIIAEMEPDEATEALREFDGDARDEILAGLPATTRDAVQRLLGYDEETAGGIMTTVLAIVRRGMTVADVIDSLRALANHRDDLDAVLVVDEDGVLLDDVSVFELAVADRATDIGDLVGPPWPIVVAPDAPLDDVVDAVLSNRRSSIVVADEAGRPLGRILLDDVLDALTRTPSRVRPNVGDR